MTVYAFFFVCGEADFSRSPENKPPRKKEHKGFHSMKVLVVATLVAVSALAEANIDGKFAER